jgi:flagellin
MAVINTNVSALYSQNAMIKNSRSMSTTMEQLSTGVRVNSAKDDAAGLAIGQNMTSTIRGLNQAVRNANDGINMMQTAEGAMIEQSNMLQRMRELAVQAMNGTYSDVQRGYLDKEYQALSVQINRIATDTKWNDQSLLNGASGGSGSGTAVFTYQVGKDSGQTITVSIGTMSASGLSITATDVGTVTTATATLSAIATALETINSQRAGLGAAINRLQYATDNLTNISTNATQSRSTIMDTDYAVATSQLAKNQIIQQAATAMLAQANQQPQSVLSLLKG